MAEGAIELLILSLSYRDIIGDKPRLSLKLTIPNLIVLFPLLLVVDTSDTSKRFRFGFASVTLKSMETGLIRVVMATVIGCMLWIQMTGAFAQSRVEIDVSHDLVTIDVDQVDLRLVLKELALQGDFKLWMPQNLPALQTSLRIEKQPLKIALRKLLADSNYALVLDDNDAVSAIYVLPKGDGQPVGPLTLDLGGINRQLIMDATQSEVLADTLSKMTGSLNDLNSELLLQTVPESASDPSGAPAIGDIIEQLQQFQSTLPETMGKPAPRAQGR